MSRRRQIAALAVVTIAVAGVSATGASAKAKPKVKTMKGSYPVTLLPDPVIDVAGQSAAGGADACHGGVNPKSVDIHALTLPGNGTLHVVLSSPDPTDPAGGGNTDWDLAILNAHGDVIDASNGGTSYEETTDVLKKGKVSIEVCNLVGEPNANVSYTFTYK